MEQGKANKIMVVIQIIFVIWGLIYLLAGGVGIHTGYAIINGGQKVQGVVQSFERVHLAGRSPFNFLQGYKITANYQTQNGNVFSAQGYANDLNIPTVGKNVTIIYFPNNPSSSLVYDPLSFWGSNILELIIGFAFIIGVFRYNRKNKTNPQAQLEFEQAQFQKFQQRSQNVNPYGFLGAQNPHIIRNVLLLFVIIFGGFILFGLLLSSLGFK